MTHLLLRAGSLLCAGCLIGAAVYAADFPAVRGDRASGWLPQSRSEVLARNGMVAASQPLAAQAGLQVLREGGNAIDAGCAAGIALGVLQPDLVNVAGVAPILIRLADGTVESIAGLGWWPKTLPADAPSRAQ